MIFSFVVNLVHPVIHVCNVDLVSVVGDFQDKGLSVGSQPRQLQSAFHVKMEIRAAILVKHVKGEVANVELP